MQRRKMIQVFEHDLLKVGGIVNGVKFEQQHFEALLQFSAKNGHTYFRPAYQGIRFSSYVGVIQVKDLIIEVLPKTDRETYPDKAVWQGVLIDLLQYCGLVKVSFFWKASLKTKAGTILDWLVEAFLEEVSILIRQGLVKVFQSEEANQFALRGRLLFSKHIQKNSFHQERFFVKYHNYTFVHPIHQILRTALHAINNIQLPEKLKIKSQKLLLQFPDVPILKNWDKRKTYFPSNRKFSRYERALELANLLLYVQQPEPRGGHTTLLGFFFDMNRLFEAYVFRQLWRQQTHKIKVRRQVGRPFWDKQYIYPDILLEGDNNRWVLDTKWKILKTEKPAPSDLRQMYVYAEYYQAHQAILVFPKVGNQKNIGPIPFSAIEGKQEKAECRLVFVEFVKNGKLNTALGKSLIELIYAKAHE